MHSELKLLSVSLGIIKLFNASDDEISKNGIRESFANLDQELERIQPVEGNFFQKFSILASIAHIFGIRNFQTNGRIEIINENSTNERLRHKVTNLQGLPYSWRDLNDQATNVNYRILLKYAINPSIPAISDIPHRGVNGHRLNNVQHNR